MVGSLFYVMGITVCNLHPFDFLISLLYHHACLSLLIILIMDAAVFS